MFDTRAGRLFRCGEAPEEPPGASIAGRLPPAARLRETAMPAFLARHYDEPTDVERSDGTPSAFLWRGRRHVVRSVLAHWWQTGPWWERLVAGGVDDDEREWWRVEAVAPGRSSIVVDLSFSWSTATWSVVAVLD